ncbi:MAG: hypothetical protein GDA45_00825 [Chromatiales bacterium]|nr:hypothetical protein [Chromatiales bacterium]
MEYRKDMKRKAIAELEILPWLRKEIKKVDQKAHVEKHGGDKFMMKNKFVSKYKLIEYESCTRGEQIPSAVGKYITLFRYL